MISVCNRIHDLIDQMGTDVHSYLDENHALVRKYALLLLGYVVLTGGGQRPQVYASLQNPSPDVLESWEGQTEEERVAVKLYPTADKTARNTFCPGVMFALIAGEVFVIYAYVRGSATYSIGANDGVWGVWEGYGLRRLACLGVYGL
jgi:hypothetical protein